MGNVQEKVKEITTILKMNWLRSGRERQTPAINVLVVTDIGNDYDDMMAILILGFYHKLRKIRLRGIIVTLRPIEERAQLTDGLFRKMDITDVEVALGTKGTDHDREQAAWTEEAMNASFRSRNKHDFPDYLDLSKRVLEDARRKGEKVRILSIAGLRDTWKIIERDEQLFREVVSEVHIQGGVDDQFHAAQDARNNTDDLDAANRVYAFLKDHNIPCTIYNKLAAFVSGFKKDVFDPGNYNRKHMKEVAAYIHNIHDRQKLAFYTEALKPKQERHNTWMDRGWFIKSSCTADLPNSLKIDEKSSADEIIKYTKVTPYDPIAALGCIREVVHVPVPRMRLTGEMYVVGQNLTEKDGQVLAEGIRSQMKQALEIR
ncbi:hypothetical protein M011DRAFT_458967 [Sporormia fimetaria CBS 119925]|uniref:Inosine/uridine-preferring nucleoside hydrolase domain-containing protein n=1 Tax=Sporormia fimetaria CBS 119925 TaxID=1340428 RepID=A0A6A6VCJ3_9PLEO|nr:hypothetical protein M011DRAFT_458967 [Sporormia fimetaria CBS 119925]